MKVKYIGPDTPGCLMHDNIYECLGEECGLYRIIDEEGIDESEILQGYLYEKHLFVVVSG